PGREERRGAPPPRHRPAAPGPARRGPRRPEPGGRPRRPLHRRAVQPPRLPARLPRRVRAGPGRLRRRAPAPPGPLLGPGGAGAARAGRARPAATTGAPPAAPPRPPRGRKARPAADAEPTGETMVIRVGQAPPTMIAIELDPAAAEVTQADGPAAPTQEAAAG